MPKKDKAPAFQFYPDKYQDHTTHLSAEAYRAYHRLLCWMWSHSPDQHSMNDSDIAWKIATKVSDTALLNVVRAEIMEPEQPLLRIRKRDEKLYNNGLKKERDKQAKRRKQTSSAAKQRWHKDLTPMQTHSKRTDSALRKPCPLSPSLSPTPPIVKKKRELISYTPDFKRFYNAYPRSTDKHPGFIAFGKVMAMGIAPELVIKGAMAYANHCAKEGIEQKFIKQPATWLNNHCWEDEYGTQANKSGMADGAAMMAADDARRKAREAGK